MMLLTAFVLVIGFVALSGMVARVAQLPEETRQATDRPIYIESKAVARGIEGMLERINDVTAVDESGDTVNYPQAYLDNVNDAAAHMERLESARGFRLKFVDDPPVTCDSGVSPMVVSVTFSLTDVDTRLTFTATYQVKPAADTSDPPDGPTEYACPP